MTLTQLFHLLGEARRLSSHDEFVIIGSLSVLGISEGMEIPDAMAMSQDVGCYTKADPGRVFDLVQALGEGSEYEAQTSFYLDAVSPDLPTLPAGWQTRLVSPRGWGRAHGLTADARPLSRPLSHKRIAWRFGHQEKPCREKGAKPRRKWEGLKLPLPRAGEGWGEGI